MGYFSNGTEGEEYEEKYCSKCLHSTGQCAVWDAHLLYNYEECNNELSVLHVLIPRDKGLNLRCKMFIKERGSKPLRVPLDTLFDSLG